LNYFYDVGSSINPWMSIKNDETEPTVIHGSKERNNVFYCHKFELAILDLHSTEFALSSASADEERSYLQVSGSLPDVDRYRIPIGKYHLHLHLQYYIFLDLIKLIDKLISLISNQER
jgi:hypothetical protein